MVVAVSVVVTGKDIRPLLDDFIESLDRQSLPTDAFEAVFQDLGSSDETLDRLEVMAAHRPNLILVEVDPDRRREVKAAAVPANYLEHCSGEYVLRLHPDQLLYPEALERLYDYAVKHDLDAVAGRVVQPGAAVPALFTADAPSLDPESSAAALTSPVVMIRRSLAAAAADPGTVALGDLPRVGVLASSPTLRQPAARGDTSTEVALALSAPRIEWADDQLSVTLTVRATSASGVDLGGARPRGLLRHVKDQFTYLLGEGEPLRPVEDGPDWTCQLKLVVDVQQGAAGERLAQGLWEVDVQLAGADIEAPPVTIGWAACRSAVLGRVMVVPSPIQTPTWQLDVGPTVWPLVADSEPAAASVVESAAGSFLVLQLPGVHVSGQEEIEGELALERLPLAARVITNGASARLESFVSGLAGAPRIATRFGDVPMKQTGLVLNITGGGRMNVAEHVPPQPPPAVTAPPPPPKSVAPAAKTATPPTVKPAVAPGAKPPAKKAPAKKVPATPATVKKAPAQKTAPAKPLTQVQKMRRRLPSSLEPLVKRVAKSETARNLYRRIAKL